MAGAKCISCPGCSLWQSEDVCLHLNVCVYVFIHMRNARVQVGNRRNTVSLVILIYTLILLEKTFVLCSTWDKELCKESV